MDCRQVMLKFDKNEVINYRHADESQDLFDGLRFRLEFTPRKRGRYDDKNLNLSTTHCLPRGCLFSHQISCPEHH
jgi:hypothetical protein